MTHQSAESKKGKDAPLDAMALFLSLRIWGHLVLLLPSVPNVIGCVVLDAAEKQLDTIKVILSELFFDTLWYPLKMMKKMLGNTFVTLVISDTK
ncbi:MAG: hypothetical protein A2729_05195 [Candidatus Buchananbacteria bacterium RIFCSPHIGHO2_01_FULL_39_14]|uniref:Uncharacterized protein n=2 Tax=Candidatus Buchananiibacteriota TaxID=1817903 RepID=A0A1G1YS50_9BACT|nr:MAG: hypothetical protein A2729_05195 [Candidatus Buchananbacteria bacterium RIFCSPHIGHO2_01_FULL_39_14]OGY48108.1 MAG: hypothetical protein A3D39_03570 [Candidatus Buchananbacteria bacterium RIFCSPHIGHO2_02_FULL_39_17]OGY54460.1 MAG: hypothetical protein A2912_05705 [Candidatus Buchananbacteria bacterium RIFCSPLOWO2_01_FULL_40_23b]